MKLFYKEKIGNKRIIHILGLKFSYKKKLNYKLLYEKTKKQLDYLKEHSDITKLKPATGKLREQQLKLIDFATKFFEEIKEINIKPFLNCGNLLGAIRNNGFIPWDDDLDFGLIRDDYEKLIEYAKEHFVVITYNEKKVNTENLKILIIIQKNILISMY